MRYHYSLKLSHFLKLICYSRIGSDREKAVLRIRDVYPGSDFFIPDPHKRI
jgi:hypothetical protein